MSDVIQLKASWVTKKITEILKREGVGRGFLKIYIKCMFHSLALLIAYTIVFLSPWVRIRFVKLINQRIGHYASNTELLLCGFDEGVYEGKRSTFFYTYDPRHHPICNTQLHLMWKRVIPILPFPLFIQRIDDYIKLIKPKYYENDIVKKRFERAIGCEDNHFLLRKQKKSHLFLTKKEIRKGEEMLEKMGLSTSSRFVCLMVRDDGYLKWHLPNGDWAYHDHRDADVDDYQKAAEFLADQGYYVIRMGKHVNKRFNVKHPRIIDYADSVFSSDFMDVYLVANCYFMISTSCGLDGVAQVFRKPLLITDIPVCSVKYEYAWRLFIPRKLCEKRSRRPLSFSNLRVIFENENKFISEIIKEKDLFFISNSPDEILEATKEMLNLLAGEWVQTKENNFLQEKFWISLIKEMPSNLKSSVMLPQVGADFLKRNQMLFEL